MSRRFPLLLALAAFVPPAPSGAAEPYAVAADRAELKAAGVAVDGKGLLALLKALTLPDADRAKAQALVKKLGDEDFEERQKAAKALVKMGPAVRPLLAEAQRERDAEVRKQALACLRKVGEGKYGPELLSAALRLVAHADPAGASEAILAYLPHVEDPEVLDDAVVALAAVGVKKGKADAAVAKALADKLAVRRAAAGAAVVKAGDKAARAGALKLLKDPDVSVRQRVAVAALGARDKSAVPVLIALLTAADGEDWERVDEALQALGGGKGPAAPKEVSAAAKKKYQAAWEEWWKDNGAKADLAKLDLSGRRGDTVIGEAGGRGFPPGRVYAVDSRGQERWSIGLGCPLSVQALRGGRVLVYENEGYLSERTTKGATVWTKVITACSARRLPNGRTFVVTDGKLLELDAKGNEVWSLERDDADVAAADKAGDGTVGVVTTGSVFLRLDAKGKKLHSFSVAGFEPGAGKNIQMLPGGRVLLPLRASDKVVEYDAAGKEVWAAAVKQPTNVRRLRNGHTLVTSTYTRTVVELNKAGKEVWAKKSDAKGDVVEVYCADRR